MVKNNEKMCAKCRDVKHISKFSRNKCSADNLRAECKLCVSTYVRDSRAKKKAATESLDLEKKESSQEKIAKAVAELPSYDRIIVLQTVTKTETSWTGIIASEGEDLFAEMQISKNGTMWVSSLDSTRTKKGTKKRGIRRVSPKEAYSLYKK